MAHKYTFQQVEDYIKAKTPEIRLDSIEKNAYQHLILYDAILKLLTDCTYNSTICIDGNYFCRASRRRSLGDIFMLLQYHYKEISLERVFSDLIYGIGNNELYSWYCLDINKRVYIKGSCGIFNSVSDEYGFDFTGYHFKYERGAYGYDFSAPQPIRI